jgi:hypothetical protein
MHAGGSCLPELAHCRSCFACRKQFDVFALSAALGIKASSKAEAANRPRKIRRFTLSSFAGASGLNETDATSE